MTEGYEVCEFTFGDRAVKFLTELYGEEYAKHWIEFSTERIADEQIYEIQSSAVIIFEPSFCLELFKENIIYSDEYTYSVEYISRYELLFLNDYWFNLIKQQKEIYKEALNKYLNSTFYENGEEIVNIDEL